MKCVVISDTHSREKKIEWFKTKENIESIDMVIHCGDFSHSQKTFDAFLTWFSNLDVKYRLLIAGNHDEIVNSMGKDEMQQICGILDIIYLEDSSITLEGIKFHGSPMSNEYGPWPFMKNDLELDYHWQKIPDDVDVLITHGPRYDVGDEVNQDIMQPNVGSYSLRLKVNELKKLKYHFFGHIHDSAGELHLSDDGKLTSYNASIMDYWFMPTGKPHTFNLKKGK